MMYAKPKISTYIVKFDIGECLVRAVGLDEAEGWAEREWGSSNGPYTAKVASPDDVANVQGLGGRTHEASSFRLPDD